MSDIQITIDKTTLTVDRNDDVCVVYLGQVGPTETAHQAPFIITGNASRETIAIEPGGSMVNAGLLHDHLASPHPAFKRKLDAGEFALYREPTEALSGSVKGVLDLVAVTRDPRVLRAWKAAEENRSIKRNTVVEAISKKHRLYATHSTPTPTVAKLTAPGAEPSKPKQRKAS